MENEQRIQEKIDMATSFAQNIVDILQVEASLNVAYTDGILKREFDGDDPATVIGYRGAIRNILLSSTSTKMMKNISKLCTIAKVIVKNVKKL